MKLDLRAALRQEILTGDGAMGTYLYQMGFPVGISYEELNLLRPETVADVHRRYFEAGARLIETNTFSANREKLSKYGLEGDVEAINRAGVELARKVVGKDAYVVGAIGSIRAGKRKMFAPLMSKKRCASRSPFFWIHRLTGSCSKPSMTWKSFSSLCASSAA